MRKHETTLVILLLLGGASIAAQHPTMPPGISHEEHLRQLQKDQALKQRGASAMGFDQDQKLEKELLHALAQAQPHSDKNPARPRTFCSTPM